MDWEQPWGAGLGGAVWWETQQDVAMCAPSPGGQPCPGLHQEKRDKQVKGGDSAPLLCSGVNPPGSPVFRPQALSTEKTRTCCSRSTGGHKNDKSDETPLLWGKAERVGAVQPGELTLWRDLTAAFQYLKGPTRELEKDFQQGHVVIGQGVTASSWKRIGLD